MQVTLLGRRREVLPLDLQAPPGVVEDEFYTFRIQRHPTAAAIALSLYGAGGVAGVWDSATGALLWLPGDGAADTAWSPDGSEIYVLAARFGLAPNGGIAHRLLRYSWPGRELQEELIFGVPSGGVRSLTISPRGRFAAVMAFQGPEWYVEVIGLSAEMRQLGIGHRMETWHGDPPEFSPEERYLVSLAGPGPFWWVPGDLEDEADAAPAEGGEYEIGEVCLHDLKLNRTTRHRIVVDLPEGWRPREQIDDWTTIWGPVFLEERSFRIWLPDRAPLDLKLPLPATIRIPGLNVTLQTFGDRP
jgi:hypothetical protein